MPSLPASCGVLTSKLIAGVASLTPLRARADEVIE
jgi:hypothetical protein